MDLEQRVPTLLKRARALLRLQGGPEKELTRHEVKKAAEAVSALHDGLVRDRALARPETYEGAALGAYLLWWWPQTYLKTRFALRAAPMPRAPRILDLGAGPGPAAIAALDELGGDAEAVDANAAALREAQAIEPRLQLRHEALQPAAASPRGSPAGAAAAPQLVLAANLLSELPEEARLPLLRSFAGAGAVVLIEPALRETGRELLRLRDALLAEGAFQALAPCLTQRPCPALVSDKDWCTAELLWKPPRYFAQLAEATGLRADERLSFAYVVLGPRAAEPAPEVWRVVGTPPPEKGKKRVFVCSDAGREALVRLERDGELPALQRGDLVQLKGLERRGDGLRAGPSATVIKLP